MIAVARRILWPAFLHSSICQSSGSIRLTGDVELEVTNSKRFILSPSSSLIRISSYSWRAPVGAASRNHRCRSQVLDVVLVVLLQVLSQNPTSTGEVAPWGPEAPEGPRQLRELLDRDRSRSDCTGGASNGSGWSGGSRGSGGGWDVVDVNVFGVVLDFLDFFDLMGFCTPKSTGFTGVTSGGDKATGAKPNDESGGSAWTISPPLQDTRLLLAKMMNNQLEPSSWTSFRKSGLLLETFLSILAKSIFGFSSLKMRFSTSLVQRSKFSSAISTAWKVQIASSTTKLLKIYNDMSYWWRTPFTIAYIIYSYRLI